MASMGRPAGERPLPQPCAQLLPAAALERRRRKRTTAAGAEAAASAAEQPSGLVQQTDTVSVGSFELKQIPVRSLERASPSKNASAAS
jgi:hypothetical protein